MDYTGYIGVDIYAFQVSSRNLVGKTDKCPPGYRLQTHNAYAQVFIYVSNVELHTELKSHLRIMQQNVYK